MCMRYVGRGGVAAQGVVIMCVRAKAGRLEMKLFLTTIVIHPKQEALTSYG